MGPMSCFKVTERCALTAELVASGGCQLLRGYEQFAWCFSDSSANHLLLVPALRVSICPQYHIKPIQSQSHSRRSAWLSFRKHEGSGCTIASTRLTETNQPPAKTVAGGMLLLMMAMIVDFASSRALRLF